MNIFMKLEQAVPAQLVRIRPMSREDAILLTQWIVQGRREGAFHGETTLGTASLLSYQESLQQSGWEYRCMVVEDAGQAIGYLDYRYHGQTAEILGLYLEAPFRHRRIGRHMLRWTLADLRERGCREVQVMVYANNTASLGACRSVGFQRDAARAKVEDGKHNYTLSRTLEPFERLSPPEPHYAFVQGENLYLHHVAVAEALVEQIQEDPGVEVILGLGSLARGFGDAWSDIDLAVLGRGPGVGKLWRGERWFAGLSVDLYPVDLEASPPSTWDDTRLQAFEESLVLFRRHPSAVQALRQALRLGTEARRERTRELLFKIGWLGFEPRTWYGQHKYGYTWALPHDLWIKRGCVAAAHVIIDRVLDYALQILFLTNDRRIPDPKWRHYLVSGLPWLPEDFHTLFKNVEEAPRDYRGFQLRSEALFLIIECLVERLEATGDITGDIYTAYLRTSQDYDSGA